MIDIVERLRISAEQVRMPPDCAESMLIAADEIERLRTELANLRAIDVHSCHANCTRSGCVNARLRNEVDDLRAAMDDRDDALGQLRGLVAALTKERSAALVDAQRYRSLAGKP